MSSGTLLVVEDERIIALDLRSKLVRLGYTVLGMAHTGEEAVRMVDDLKPDMVLMDVILDGGMDGVDALCRIRERHAMPVLFVSACNDATTRDRAMKAGCVGFLSKPVDMHELAERLSAALIPACSE